DRIVDSLSKSGDCAFKIDEVNFTDFEDGFIRVSDLNNLRREALEGIQKSITKSFRRKRPNKIEKTDEIKNNLSNLDIIYQCITKEQLNTLIEEGIKDIIVDIFNRDKEAIQIKDLIEVSQNKEIN
ncbi:DUF3656 domain-containing protein, partial [Clostridium perfringens]|uniref:DUF3656 domain-containing protein n=1 Tax=Clostridium perfringens TaxID=1502 RepID=UPI002ACE4A17